MDLTPLFDKAPQGDADARAEFIQAAYDDLRKLAAAKMADERANHTLSSTALVHEVSVRMMTDAKLPVADPSQFLAYASKAMRNYLIDHARNRGRQKRGGERKRLTFDDVMIACEEQRDDILALNEALERLAEVSPRRARLVEMRYFGGLSNQEIAEALDISPATVKRDWAVAKTWLLNKLRQGGGE